MGLQQGSEGEPVGTVSESAEQKMSIRLGSKHNHLGAILFFGGLAVSAVGAYQAYNDVQISSISRLEQKDSGIGIPSFPHYSHEDPPGTAPFFGGTLMSGVGLGMWPKKKYPDPDYDLR